MKTPAWSLFVFLVPLAMLQLSAALPPHAFQQGPEKLKVRVEASHSAGDRKQTQVTMLFRVLEVRRSESGLVPGDAILVLYIRDHEKYNRERRAYNRKARSGWVGPQLTFEPAALEVGDERMVFLRPARDPEIGRVFEPSGYQYSFESVERFEREEE